MSNKYFNSRVFRKLDRIWYSGMLLQKFNRKEEEEEEYSFGCCFPAKKILVWQKVGRLKVVVDFFWEEEEEAEVALIEQVHMSCPGNGRLGWTFPCYLQEEQRSKGWGGKADSERERVCGKRSEKELGLRWEIRV